MQKGSLPSLARLSWSQRPSANPIPKKQNARIIEDASAVDFC